MPHPSPKESHDLLPMGAAFLVYSQKDSLRSPHGLPPSIIFDRIVEEPVSAFSFLIALF